MTMNLETIDFYGRTYFVTEAGKRQLGDRATDTEVRRVIVESQVEMVACGLLQPQPNK